MPTLKDFLTQRIVIYPKPDTTYTLNLNFDIEEDDIGHVLIKFVGKGNDYLAVWRGQLRDIQPTLEDSERGDISVKAYRTPEGKVRFAHV